ncbi:MAG TPA: N-acetylmuramoyl-L-alanine amidase, partial [Herbaspirillum sp.]
MPRSTEIRTKSLDSKARRTVLKAGGSLLFSVLAYTPMLARAAQIVAVRVWPAEEYTRVT